MVTIAELPQKWQDYLAMLVCAVAGIAWGVVMANCWIDAVKDEKKRKQEAQQQLNERFYHNDGRK